MELGRMAHPKKTFRPAPRICSVVFAVLLVLFGTACDDFYSDSLPTPPIAQPTPAGDPNTNPEEVIEAGARTALAAALGINIEAPRKILLEDATWTDSAPGCYPPPPGVSGPYLVPGYRLLMQFEGVFYEYDADLGGATGALCDSTLQHVPVEPALDVVTVNPNGATQPDMSTVYILRSEADVAEFNSSNSEIATIAVDVVDWTVEVLVGGWVNIGPITEAVRAYREPSDVGTNADRAVILIEVEVPESLADAANDNPSQAWAQVDITEPDSTYRFISVKQ
jgi:hypothetical protein